MGLLFAASNPARVSSLVLINSYARLPRADDYPAGVPVHDPEYTLRASYPPPGSARLPARGHGRGANTACLRDSASRPRPRRRRADSVDPGPDEHRSRGPTAKSRSQ